MQHINLSGVDRLWFKCLKLFFTDITISVGINFTKMIFNHFMFRLIQQNYPDSLQRNCKIGKHVFSIGEKRLIIQQRKT